MKDYWDTTTYYHFLMKYIIEESKRIDYKTTVSANTTWNKKDISLGFDTDDGLEWITILIFLAVNINYNQQQVAFVESTHIVFPTKDSPILEYNPIWIGAHLQGRVYVSWDRVY